MLPMLRRSLLAATSLLLTLTGCDRKQPAALVSQPDPAAANSLAAPPEITSESGSALRNLIFYVKDSTLAPDNSRTLHAEGLHRGQPVGFDLTLAPKWTTQQASSLTMRPGTAAIHSAGAPSDALIAAIDEIYETNLHPKSMIPTLTLAAISLEGDPTALERAPTRLKMFIESQDGSDNAEFYININLNTHRLELSEKDPDYRPAIIKALTAH